MLFTEKTKKLNIFLIITSYSKSSDIVFLMCWLNMKKHTNFIELKIKDADKLLNEMYSYIKWQAPLDIKGKSPGDIFKVSCEAMRITVRIMRIISWLMIQKGIVDGELPQDAPSNRPRIFQGKPCLENLSENDPQLPPRLRELLKKSRDLYMQTMRLEEISLKKALLPEEIKNRRESE